MPLIRLPNAGSVGLNKDLSQHELPINAFTDALDIRFLDGYIHQFLGHGQVYGMPEIVPYHLLPLKINSEIFWIYAGAAKIYAVDNTGGVTTHTNLTRQTAGVDVDYSASPNEWTSTLLGGIPIMNPGNEIDPPQQWNLDIASNFQALDAWPADTFCKSMRSYKNILIALNITKSGNRFPYMVKWSHPADPGGVPISWDEADPTFDAGEFDLAEGYDEIIDGMSLRDAFIIYKESSVWRLDYSGGAFIFRNQKVLGMSGALNRNCIVDINGYHVVFTNNDIVLHDGVNATSILDKMTRRWLFQNINVEATQLCFAFHNPFFNEVFLCFPSIASTIPDRAIVFNYNDKTISIRSLPMAYCGAFGPVNAGLNGTWDADSEPWDADLTAWDGPDFVPSNARIIVGTNVPKLYLLDASASFDGMLPTAHLERRGLSFDSPESIKMIRGIRPRIVGNIGETVTIKVGAANTPYDDPVYTSTMTHTIGETIANDCFVSGRYLAIRFETGTAYNWRIDSFELDVEVMGKW